MMRLTYIPRAPLSDFVECFWLYDGFAPPHARERVLPTGTMQLIVNLRDPELPVMSGAYSEAFVLETSGMASIMGVHFKPGGAFPFFRAPAGELQNMYVTLDHLWGGFASELRDRLVDARTPAAKFHVLEQALAAQAVRLSRRHPAVAFALNAFESPRPVRTVADVTDRIGLSARRFIQVFTGEVGLTPKLFCRVRRFQDVLRRVDRTPQVDWTDVALGCGYYDQAHFIHDFRAFSGFNPTTYLRDRGDRLNHVPLTD